MDESEPVKPRQKIVLDLDWLPEPIPDPHTVTFLPSCNRAIAEHGHSVFEAAQGINEFIPTTCGGKGTCGRCRVRVETAVRAPTYLETQFITKADLAKNVRLSCRLRVLGDITVTVIDCDAAL